MNWYEQDFVGLDFETTGKDPFTARPVEVAILRVNFAEQKEDNHFHSILDIGEEIPKEASDIHGITTKRMKAEGTPAHLVMNYIMHFMVQCLATKIPLVIFNVPYDWNIFLNEAKRHNFTFEGVPMFFDPLLIDRRLDKYRKGLRQLTSVAQHYDVAIDGKMHTAETDAYAAVKVARRMIEKYRYLRSVTLEELQKLQSEWFEEWRIDIHKYWAQQGKTDQVTSVWPTK